MAAASESDPDSCISAADGRSYWEGVEATEDGMLGGIPSIRGFSSISQMDIDSSRRFLSRIGISAKRGRQSLASVLEGGAGIGRVTEGLLLPMTENLDVVEPIAKFTVALREKQGVRQVFTMGLEEWQPEEGVQYDLVWAQWCLGHLTNEQLEQWLERCKMVLTPGTGVIVVKENINFGSDAFDPVDSSVTRSDETLRRVFEQAGLHLMRTELAQLPVSEDATLYPVRMYALKYLR